MPRKHPTTAVTLPVPLTAQGRRLSDGNYEGVVRLAGHTVHRSIYAYTDPDQAAKVAVKELVTALRGLMQETIIEYPAERTPA